jgi:flagellar L-ring protein precursor FlgH
MSELPSWPALRNIAAALLLASVQAWAGPDSLLEQPLFADHIAYRPGDLLSVVITESAAATATARTRTDKRDRLSASVRLPNDTRDEVEASLGTDFSGGGQIQRTGKLLAKLAVVVEAVDDNGNLRISGEQDILVNNERQRIALSGLVRRADIAPDNSVLSSRIANARIEFKGDGLLGRQQSLGLLGLIFRLLGLN